MANCPYCCSTNIFRFRRDLDWGGRIDYYRITENGDCAPLKKERR